MSAPARDEAAANEPRQRFLAAAGRALATGDAARARARATTRLKKHPDAPEALFVLALAAALDNDLASAAGLAQQAFDGPPRHSEPADLAAVVFGLAGDLNSAFYWAKIAVSEPSSPELAALVPSALPCFGEVLARIEETPLLVRGRDALRRGALDHAEHWLRQHLAFVPDSRDGYALLALCLLAQGHLHPAADVLRAARHRLPEEPELARLLGHVLTRLARFDEAAAVHHGAASHGAADPGIGAAILLDTLADPRCDAPAAAERFRDWGRTFGLSVADRSLPAAMERQRLTLGLFIAGAAAEVSAEPVSRLFACLDPQRYTIVGFGDGSLSGPASRVFQPCVDRWVDVGAVDPATFAALVRGEGIDVLIDLAGFTAPKLLTAFGARMAPCQVGWLNAPYGFGLAAMDYLLTDGYVDPVEAGVPADGERPIRLALGCVPFGRPEWSEPTQRRAEADGIVFAADATLAELHPATVACWSEILHRLPGSSLVLRDNGFREPAATADLVARFGNFGLSHRIDVSDGASDAAFYAEADVALLAGPMPRPQVVLAALRAGVPLICPAGRARHQRFAASVLHHLGLGARTIAQDDAEYVREALAWAQSPERRIRFRSQLPEKVAASGAADPRARACDLDAAISRMWAETVDRTLRREGRAA